MAAPRRILLGQLLVAAGAITEEELEVALVEQRRTKGLLGETIVRLGLASEVVVAEAIAEQTGIPFHRDEPAAVPDTLRKLVSVETCRRHRLVPIGADGSVLRVAMTNPFDVVALEDLKATTGLTPFPSIALWSDIERAIRMGYEGRARTAG